MQTPKIEPPQFIETHRSGYQDPRLASGPMFAGIPGRPVSVLDPQAFRLRGLHAADRCSDARDEGHLPVAWRNRVSEITSCAKQWVLSGAEGGSALDRQHDPM